MAEKKPSLNFERTRPARNRSRSSVYTDLIEQFLASDKPEAMVEGVPSKMSSQYTGLRNAVKSLELEDKVLVTRYTKEEQIWLVRKDMEPAPK